MKQETGFDFTEALGGTLDTNGLYYMLLGEGEHTHIHVWAPDGCRGDLVLAMAARKIERLHNCTGRSVTWDWEPKTMGEKAQDKFNLGTGWVTCLCGDAPGSINYEDGSTWVLTPKEKRIAELRHEAEFGPEANPALSRMPLNIRYPANDKGQVS